MKRLVSSALVLGTLLSAPVALAAQPSTAGTPHRLQYQKHGDPSRVNMDPATLALAVEHVEDIVDDGQVDGAVLLVARHGQVVVHRAFGKRDGNLAGGYNPSMPLDGIFDLQSITKVFTSYVAMQLHAEGKLDIDAPVGTYLPEYAVGDKADVRVRDFMRYTSGLFIDATILGSSDPWAAMVAEELAYTPNSRVYYSDLGYRLLGRTIETAGGASLDALMEEYIFEPLGMKDTGYAPYLNMPHKASRFVGTKFSDVRGHYMRGEVADEQDYFIETHGHGVTGCDGVFSTAWDLALFGQMLVNHGAHVWGKTNPHGVCPPGNKHCHVLQLLPASLSDATTSLQTADVLSLPAASTTWVENLLRADKGYGWELPEYLPGAYSPGGQLISMLGATKTGGAGTFIMIDPDPSRDLVVVLLTNHGLPSHDDLGVDENGELLWPGYDKMLEGIGPDTVNDLVQLSIVGP
ncbi:serine hydrolase domain-containing protein [Polyangium aurulentum]|uniref:serine hydrolase domain-containing protein n=1 Tax=Polyangium aurulentum TaxID=2567896 RepID=UPI0010AEC688|nr:serine hydrolase domain-containing protein [Polyangium aurulentum]UQA60121.1 beta-lactamase family protein [Polyangium aurulentum]